MCLSHRDYDGEDDKDDDYDDGEDDKDDDYDDDEDDDDEDDDDDDEDNDFEKDRDVEVDEDEDERGVTLTSRSVAGNLRDDQLTFSVRLDQTGIQVRFAYKPNSDDDNDQRLRYRLFATDLVEFTDANGNGQLDVTDSIVARTALSTCEDARSMRG